MNIQKGWRPTKKTSIVNREREREEKEDDEEKEREPERERAREEKINERKWER